MRNQNTNNLERETILRLQTSRLCVSAYKQYRPTQFLAWVSVRIYANPLKPDNMR